mgnify:CR=1 FL=1
MEIYKLLSNIFDGIITQDNLDLGIPLNEIPAMIDPFRIGLQFGFQEMPREAALRRMYYGYALNYLIVINC